MKKILICMSFVVLASCGKINSDSANPEGTSSLPWTNTWTFNDGDSSHTLVISTSQIPQQDYDISVTLPNFTEHSPCKAISDTVLSCGMVNMNDTLVKNVNTYSVTLTPGFSPSHTYTFYAPGHVVVDAFVGSWNSTDNSACQVTISKLNDTQYSVTQSVPSVGQRTGVFDMSVNNDSSRTLTVKPNLSSFSRDQTFTLSANNSELTILNDFGNCGNEKFSKAR